MFSDLLGSPPGSQTAVAGSQPIQAAKQPSQGSQQAAILSIQVSILGIHVLISSSRAGIWSTQSDYFETWPSQAADPRSSGLAKQQNLAPRHTGQPRSQANAASKPPF